MIYRDREGNRYASMLFLPDHGRKAASSWIFRPYMSTLLPIILFLFFISTICLDTILFYQIYISTSPNNYNEISNIFMELWIPLVLPSAFFIAAARVDVRELAWARLDFLCSFAWYLGIAACVLGEAGAILGSMKQPGAAAAQLDYVAAAFFFAIAAWAIRRVWMIAARVSRIVTESERPI